MDGCTRNLARIRPWATPSSPWQGGPVLRHHGSSRGAGGQDVAACGCWRLGSSLQVSFGATQTCGRCPCSTLPWALRQKHRPSEICPLPPLSEPSARPRIATALAPLEGRANRRRTADPDTSRRRSQTSGSRGISAPQGLRPASAFGVLAWRERQVSLLGVIGHQADQRRDGLHPCGVQSWIPVLNARSEVAAQSSTCACRVMGSMVAAPAFVT